MPYSVANLDPLSSVLVPPVGQTLCINAENPNGKPGTAEVTSSPLGEGRKACPCIRDITVGEQVTLAEINQSGIVHHIWMTVPESTSARGRNVLRNLILKVYWDGESSPSVCVPLGDFFCCGNGRSTQVSSLPIVVNPHNGLNSYFQMPFESMRIVIENLHNETIPELFYQIDAELLSKESDTVSKLMRFHAQWRRTRVTRTAQDYAILDGVSGTGKYVGTYLALTALESRWWGEGEVKIFIDNDRAYPSYCSTGTEDYFGGAWSFSQDLAQSPAVEQTFSTLFQGYPFYSRNTSPARSPYWDDSSPVVRGLYRWHLLDSINFASTIKVTLQQIGSDENGLFERNDDLASVAYWYQQEPHIPFPDTTLHPSRELLKPR